MARILALVDASIYAQSVCDHAAWVALRMKASVELVHVLGRRDVSGDLGDLSGALDPDGRDTLLADLSELDARKAQLAQQRGRLLLETAQQRLRDAGVEAVTSKLRIDDLVDTVQALEADADLIVVGKRGEAADFARLHLGSNLERVVRASHRPVLVAARAFKPIGRVLVAFDGGPSIAKAIDYLVASHAMFGTLEIELLRAATPSPDVTDSLEQTARRLRTAGYSVKTAVAPGHAETVITTRIEAGGVDLLMMGAYGHSRIRNLIIGSTTTEMIRSCRIPLVLFR